MSDRRRLQTSLMKRTTEAAFKTVTGTLATRRCTVIVDEAHSSQSGETATDLKEVLGGEQFRAEAKKRTAEEGREDMEEIFRSMAKRGKQAKQRTPVSRAVQVVAGAG